MPIDRRDQHWRAAARTEIAEQRPDENRRQNAEPRHDMRHVEPGDGEIERTVAVGARGKILGAPLEILHHDENDAENERRADAGEILAAPAATHAAIAEYQ